MKAKKQKTKQDQDQPVNGTWEPIREREALPNVKKEREIKAYFLDMYKNNAPNIPAPMTYFASEFSRPDYNVYSYRLACFMGFFVRDLHLTNRAAEIDIKRHLTLRYDLGDIVGPARSGVLRRSAVPSLNVISCLSYLLGFESVFSFLSFLESVYSVPYNRMMSGEGVKRGQPWYCLNYENGTKQQGPNDDEEQNNTDL
jgi:hypothetical protein